ncbi:MAG: electron transfer flavoprotein subunit alpha/FixB family protein [Dehalococcoidia bacterium]
MTESLYGPDEAQGVWLYLEHDDGMLDAVSRELLGKGRELSRALHAPLTGMLLGRSVVSAAGEAVAWGADRVVMAQDPLLEPYTTDAHAQIAMQLVATAKPDVLLLSATPNGRDLAGRLAVRLRTGLTADCTDLAIEEETGLLLGEVVGFGGGIVATIKCERHRPQMATVRPGVFAAADPDPARRGAIDDVPVDLDQSTLRVRVVEREVQRGASIADAELLVVGGAGTGGDFALLEELATALGAELGVTRVAVDAGWASHERQVGQTGYVTRPKLAIVCGASGAQQFTVGIDQAETVLAVNADADAPIFDSADYSVVGDLFDILPPLVEEVRGAQAQEAADSL